MVSGAGGLYRSELGGRAVLSCCHHHSSSALANFNFAATPVHVPQVRDLAAGGFLASIRNIMAVDGTRQQQCSQKPLRIRASIGYTVQHERRWSAH